jgi:DNA-directed RNA polymerase specialized sigma24 family protein
MATDEEFRRFFTQHYERLCRLGFLLTGDPAQAEGLAQDALVRTWRRWRLVGKPNNPETYARKVLVNGTGRCCSGQWSRLATGPATRGGEHDRPLR